MKRLTKRPGSKTLLRVIVVSGALVAIALLWVSLDFFLSSNPKTAGPWEEFKAEVSRDVHANGIRLWAGATENMSGSKKENALPPAQPTVQTVAPPQIPTPKAESHVDTSTASKRLTGAKPYVTSGLTPMEVLSILGNPTS